MNKFYSIIQQLLPGDRVVVPKSNWDLVQHHALYVGFENGHHWFIENKDGIGVRTVRADTFFTGVQKITRVVKFHPRIGYSRQDLVRKALARRGRAYSLMNYNCEHFANEIQNHKVESKQADTGFGVALFGIALLLLGGVVVAKN